MSTTPDNRPTIALTVGDIAGVGPELVAMCLSEESLYSMCRPIVIGPKGVFEARGRAIGVSLATREVLEPSPGVLEFGTVELVEPPGIDMDVPLGEVDPRAGRIAALCLQAAFEMAAEKKIQGVVGAPLNKQAFRLAGYDYLDEIAFLAELSHSPEPRLFGILDRLWTTCVTLHVPFKDIASRITRERVFEAIVAMHDALERSGTAAPSVAVAALNPHNGEGGLLGTEEVEEIAPAVEAACTSGLDARGPFSADTLFPRSFAEGINGVVCMHHDQANIARKLHGFRDSASVFLGLPVPYATTAHGTAFDLVGQGAADPSSFMAALRFVVGQCHAQGAHVSGSAPAGTALI